eukprot:2746805-Ditylum_brightwellii.AAC.1
MHSAQRGEGDTHMARSRSARSDDSLSTLGAEDDHGVEKNVFSAKIQYQSPILGASLYFNNHATQQSTTSESSLRNLMMAYDSTVFVPLPKKERAPVSAAPGIMASIHSQMEVSNRTGLSH